MPHPQDLQPLFARAHELADRPGRTIVGIAGPPASGKSTLAAALAAEMGTRAALVPMDGFHLDDDVLRRHGSWERKGAPDTFDAHGFADLLRRLAQATDTVYAPRFRRDIEAAIAGAIEISVEVSLVITEGNYLLLDRDPWPRARAYIDETWFLSIDPELRRRRLIERHMRYGRTLREARSRALGTDETNAELIESTAAAAERIIQLD